MLTKYEEESGFRPENESDAALRMRVLAGELYREHTYADFILRQMFPATAVGEYLDAHASQRGLSRKNGTCAVGMAIFTAAAEEHGDIPIPAGTQVSTDEDGLRYATDSDAVLRAGSQTVSVAVTAVQPGGAYNIITGRLGVIVTPVIGIVSVRNAVRFSGGTDPESDEQLRERIADSYRAVSNGANAAYYRAIAMSVDGVYDASVVGCGRGTGTVDVYACGKGMPLAAGKLAEIQALLNEKREVNVDVRACSPSAVSIDLYVRLTVKDGYDFDTVAAEVQSAVTEYVNALGIGHDLLLSSVGEAIYHIEGVAGYKFLESFGSDRQIAQNRYTTARTILVRNE